MQLWILVQLQFGWAGIMFASFICYPVLLKSERAKGFRSCISLHHYCGCMTCGSSISIVFYP